MFRLVCFLAFGSLIMMSPRSFAAADPCSHPEKIASAVTLNLVSAALAENGSFVGNFRIHAAKHSEPISIGLVKVSGGEFAFYPDTSIEYMNLSGDWQRMLALPGSFRGVTRVHVLSPGHAFTFKAALISRETATMNARGFRLLLRTNSSQLCVVSKPFVGVPARPPVETLKSISSRD